MLNKFKFLLLVFFMAQGISYAQMKDKEPNSGKVFVSEQYAKGDFPLVDKKNAAYLYFDQSDFEVVKIAVKDLQSDIQSVSQVTPKILSAIKPIGENVVIIGTIGKSKNIDDLIVEKKINIDDIEGKWETFKIVVIEKPFPSVDKALVIVGSDRRATAFGVYEVSKQIGVSPWYYWADVPVKEKANIFIKKGIYQFGSPSVKYRGMFINDEKFALKLWAAEKQDPDAGGIGKNTLKKVFELMLRLKSNYLWRPLDTSLAKIADDYAIVIGSPHNENMHTNDWDKDKYGDWLYSTNKKNIYNFWDNKIKELGNYDNVYTLGMRGSGDLPMGGGLSVDEKVALMEEIIHDQREILSKNIDKKIEDIPQILVLYKEVLGLYNQGIKVPDDVTIVWPDDNYGYIERLSNSKEEERSGGGGVYYHLSYLGRPQSYLWLTTINPVLMWEELRKAYDFNCKNLWVFNVGDIKPAEYEYSLAMDMAWDMDKFNKDNIKQHLTQWMGNIFGDHLKAEISDIMYEYYRLAFERKPEYMGWDRIEPNTPIVNTEFSLTNYGELERRLNATKKVKERAEAIFNSLSQKDKIAFFELVYYPVSCSYYMDARMLLAQKNRMYAQQGRVSANSYADQSKSYSDSIEIATKHYYSLLDGKWDKIIYPGGRPPYKMPPLTKIENKSEAEMGITCEGDEDEVMVDDQLKLPWFNSVYKKPYSFELYNKGLKPFEYKVSPSNDWIIVSSKEGTCQSATKITVSIDYQKLADAGAKGKSEGLITVDGAGSSQKINVFVFFSPLKADELSNLFVEDNGVIAINAENFQRKKDGKGFGWEITKDLGVTGSSIGTYPFTAEPVEHEWKLEQEGAYVEYDFYCFNSGWIDVHSYSLPTAPINSQRNSLYGISIDDGPPLIVDFKTQLRNEKWKQNVQRNQSDNLTKHLIEKPGKHTLKIWMIDTGVFLDKIIIDFGGLKQSYEGPSQTYFSK